MNPEDFHSTSAGRMVRTIHGYWAFLPNSLPPEIAWSLPLVSALSEADRSLAQLAMAGESFPFPHLLVRPFIRKEAVLSSRIEGTQASLTDLLTYESGQLSFFEPAPDAREVFNYVRALAYGLERLATLPVSLRLIREVHARLMEGVRGEHLTPGEFRRSQNWIGAPGSTLQTARFVPPPVDEMHAALRQLEKFMHAPLEIPPLVRAALIHYQFEAIHPFLDGNGRIDRLLLILLLSEWGLLRQPLLYLSVYFEANREEYYARLTAVSQEGDWEGWLAFFLQGVSAQSTDASARIGRIQALRQDYRQNLQAQGASQRVLNALDVVFERPILSVRQMTEALGAPFASAQRYVDRLVEAGILREATGQARNRIYRADAVMQAVEGAIIG